MLSRRALLAALAQSTPGLDRVYGQTLREVVYIEAVALLARLRLGALADVERLAAPFVDGTRNSLERVTPSHLAGHLLFDALHTMTKKAAYRERVLAAAAQAKFELYTEMSDGVFMGCPLLVRAGQAALAMEHYRGLEKLCLREDGLWRHSPLCDAAWGRGNAFPALGLALAAEKDDRFVEPLQKLLAVVAPFQTPNGMWRQVIDVPQAYEEFSATAMIGTAMRKAVRRGWISVRQYEPRIELARRAIAARTQPNGDVLDVCESTGKQKTLEDYLQRKAIRGRDERGGAMALYFQTEFVPGPGL